MREKKGIAWLIIFAVVIGVFSPVGPGREKKAYALPYDESKEKHEFYISADAVASGNSYTSLEAAFDEINREDNGILDDHYVIVYVTGTIEVSREIKITKKCHVIIRSQKDGTKATIKRGNYFPGSIINVDCGESFAQFGGDVYSNHLQMQDIILDGGIVWKETPKSDPLGRSDKLAAESIKPEEEGVYREDGYMGAAFKLTAGDVRLVECIIQNNYNDHPAKGQVAKPDNSGGGIHVDENGVCNLDGCIIRNNHSRYQGGGIWKHGMVNINGELKKSDKPVQIYGNSAGDWGGGIYQVDGRSLINEVEVSNNSAKGSGGGICIHSGSLSLQNAAIYGNYIEGETGKVDGAVGGAGIRIENFPSGVTSEDNNNKKEINGNVIVSGNASKALKDGEDGLKAASGVMIDVPVDTSGNASGNFVTVPAGFNSGVNGNYVLGEGVQYDESKKTYVASGDAAPEYNVGYAGMEVNPKPTVTVSGDGAEYASGNAEEVFYHKGATKKLTVDVEKPTGTTPRITYQWYVVDAKGNKKAKIKDANKNKYTIPSDEKGEKYYSCEVSCQVDTSKLPAKVMTIPVKVTIYGLKAKDFVVKKTDLENTLKWSSLAVAMETDYADLRWQDDKAITSGDASGNASVESGTTGIYTLTDIKKAGTGKYALKYKFTHTGIDDGITGIDAYMYVVDSAGNLNGENGAVAGIVGASNTIINASKAAEIKDDQEALKTAIGAYVIKNGSTDSKELEKVKVKVPDNFEMPGVHTLTLSYDNKDVMTVSVTVVQIDATSFIITKSQLDALDSLNKTKAVNYAGVQIYGISYENSDSISVHPEINPMTEEVTTLEEMKANGVGNRYDITYRDDNTGAEITVEMMVVDELWGGDPDDGPGSVTITSGMILLGWMDIIGKNNDDEELRKLLMEEGAPEAFKDGVPVPQDLIKFCSVSIFDTDGKVLGRPFVIFDYDGKKTRSGVTIYRDVEFPIILANDFAISLDDAAKVKAGDILEKSGAKCCTELSSTGISYDIIVDANSLAELNNTKKAGKVSIKLIYDDKASNEAEKVITVDVTGGTVSGNGTALGNGTDSGDSSGNSAGNSSGDEKAKEELTFDLSNPEDIIIGIESGKVVDKVVIDGATLPDGDYTIDGDKLVIKNETFIDKAEGTHSIEVSFKDGTKKTYTINVVPFDEKTVMPLNKVPIFNLSKTIGVGKKYKLNLVGLGSNAYIDPNNTKSSNKKVATIDPKTMVIKGKKKGKCNIQVAVVQNGSYYSVKIKLTVKKNKATYNIKNKALSKKKGTLPEFNDYMSVKKGKKTKLKFSQLEKSAKVKYTTGNKKVVTVSKKGVIKGKKKGFSWITAQIEQNGHIYYTRVLVQVDDGTKNKQMKKFLTTKLK